MKNILIFIIISLHMQLFANQSVLIINSYHKGYEWSDKVVNGIEEVFHNKSKIDLNILYMDSKRVTSKEYYESLKQLYSVQLKHRKYDLIIAIDRFAYDFILKSYDNFFLNEPILAVGIENYSEKNSKKYNLEKKISALLEKRDLISNARLIENLIPNLKNLYIVNDKSLNAEHTEPLIKELLKNHNSLYNLEYIKENNLKSLKEKFSKVQMDSAILFIRFYKNENGDLNKNQEIASFIKNAKLPVFITDSIFINKGAIGGKIIQLKEFGKSSAHMALDILKTKNMQIKVSNDLYYVFDEQKLKHFDLKLENLNHKFTLVNKNLNFFERNRGFINFVFLISPLLIFLILGLFHNIYMRKKVEKILRQRLHFDSVLLNAIESPIFWQDKDGLVVDSNEKFCKLLNVNANELYKNTLEKFIHIKNVKKIINVLSDYSKNKILQFKHIDENDELRIYLIKQAKYFDKKTKNSGIVTIFTDITKEKQIEKDKERSQEFIIQQSKLAEIGEIFSSIAHQWKSPLVEITTIAQESFYSNSSNQNEDESYVNDIMTQVKYMNDTINDFQDFIMPSHEKREFDVLEAIHSMLEIVEHNIKYNYLNIHINVEKDTLLKVYGFRNEFMQSFLNIINNAKDELIKNDLKNREINIKIYNENPNLIILIEDNAGGIKDNFIEDIFKAYFSTKKNGHGIGLYMAKMIIEDKMNGKISVKNIKSGAQFKIVLGNKSENISS